MARCAGRAHGRRLGRLGPHPRVDGKRVRKLVLGRTRADVAAKLGVLQRAKRESRPIPDQRAKTGVFLQTWLEERKAEPDTLAQLEELEFALSAAYPYKLLARFFHVIAQKA